MATDDKILKNAQYRKTLGIAGFNAVNSALTAIALEGGIPKPKKGKKKVTLESRIDYWIKHFLKIHEKYYAEVVANVGAKNYDPKDAIGKLMATTNYPDLAKVWMALSADEKADDAIIKVAQELKTKFQNEKA